MAADTTILIRSRGPGPFSARRQGAFAVSNVRVPAVYVCAFIIAASVIDTALTVAVPSSDEPARNLIVAHHDLDLSRSADLAVLEDRLREAARSICRRPTYVSEPVMSHRTCVTDTIALNHDGRNGVNSWRWSMDDGKTSGLQSPEAYYTRFGEKRISLTVSNGFCSDTAELRVMLDNGIDAKFSGPT
ncbi:MAG: UrcA family protein, partial [Alphaproteobacteria bacterium]